jgi:hypothetical protein
VPQHTCFGDFDAAMTLEVRVGTNLESGDPLLGTATREPITGIAGCCARAASGQDRAAPPKSVMKSRRFNRSNDIRPPTSQELNAE